MRRFILALAACAVLLPTALVMTSAAASAADGAAATTTAGHHLLLLRYPTMSRTRIAFEYGGADLGDAARRRQGACAGQRHGHADQADLLAGRHHGRLHRHLRRQHRCLRGPGGRRPAEAPDLPPRSRRRRRLDARRQARAVPLAPLQLHRPEPALHRAGDRRFPAGTAAARGRGRLLLARRQPPRLRAGLPVGAVLEGLQGRPAHPGVAGQAVGFQRGAHSRRERQRTRPDVGRPHRVFPVRPRRPDHAVRL